jgi:hypothetical protein
VIGRALADALTFQEATMLNALILGLLLTQPASEPPWHQLYQRAIIRLDRGEAAAARADLEAALAQRSAPELGVRIDAVTSVDYLPHLYLAIACHRSGDPKSARRHLEAAAAGVAASSEVGAPLLAEYRSILGLPPSAAPAEPSPETAPEPPGYARFERQPTVLGEEELAELERRVLARCRLDPDTPPHQAPWYFHYELGLELARRHDPQRALDALIEAAQRRREPQRNVRLYGMWFRDYLPYYQIARAHAELGNWECAADALEVSAHASEISQESAEHDDYLFLREEVRSRLTP